jgi:hypothetical protein
MSSNDERRDDARDQAPDSGAIEMPSKKIFTLKEAQALLPRVRALTFQAVTRAEKLQSSFEDLPAGEKRTQLEMQYHAIVRAWAEQVVDLGLEVKGLWLVDFDSGDGLYYCWHWPEKKLEYFHDYDAGFAGRRPLGPLMVG